jgi:hypothetical protein
VCISCGGCGWDRSFTHRVGKWKEKLSLYSFWSIALYSSLLINFLPGEMKLPLSVYSCLLRMQTQKGLAYRELASSAPQTFIRQCRRSAPGHLRRECVDLSSQTNNCSSIFNSLQNTMPS